MICRSWASQDVARAVDWPCPAQYYEFRRDISTRCLSCTNQQLESLPVFSCSRDVTDTTIRKNTKATIASLKNQKQTFQAGFPFICTCCSNTRLKIQIENSRNWAGHRRNNAICDIHDITCFWYGIVLLFYLLMGDELGNATYIDCLLVSSALLSTPIFTLIENEYFGSCHTNLEWKSSSKTTKMIILRLGGYLGEIESYS